MTIQYTAQVDRDAATGSAPGLLSVPESTLPSTTTPAGPAQAPSTWRDPTAVLAAVEHLAPSTRPVEVFTSLVELCAPAFSDLCWVVVEEDAATPSPPNEDVSVRHVGLHDQTTESTGTLRLTFGRDTYESWPAFSGTMAWRWHDRDRPTRSDKVIARLLLDRACALVSTAQLQALLAAERNTAANLHTALVSNREIGKAIGILMWSYKLTDDQAFDLLRGVSQHTHRKLRDVASDVCTTGTLDVPRVKPKH
jgi:hypothetical protein